MVLLSVFSALFLVLLIALAFASIKLFAARDQNGKTTAPGCLNGCMAAVMLSVVAGLGLVAFVAGAWAIAAAEAAQKVIESSPDIQVGVWHDRASTVESKAGYPLRIVMEWKGHSEPTTTLLEKLQEAGAGSEMLVEARYETSASGEPITIVDIAIPMSEYDAAELAGVFEELRPDLSLSEGLEVTFKKVERVEER